MTTGDFSGDGRNDLATADGGSNGISVLLGNGDGTFQAARNVDIGTAPKSVLAADLNGDGKSDLVAIVTLYGEFDGVLVLLSNGDGTFSGSGAVVLESLNPINYNYSGPPVDQTALSVAVGDLSADGQGDLVVEGQTHFQVVAGYDDYGSPLLHGTTTRALPT